MRYINKKINQLSLAIAIVFTLSACGGGSDHNNRTETDPSNPTNPTTPEIINCVNGIPTNLKTSGSGFFTDETYSLESEDDADNNEGLVFLSNKTINGVLYQNITSSLKNSPKAINTDYLETYLLTRSKLDTSFKQKMTTTGFPLGYVISMNGDSSVINRFSDKCSIHSENQMKLHIKQIDISGMTIADLFKYYDYPNSSNVKRYIGSHIAYILDNDKDSLNKLLQDQTKFPQGSKLGYIDQSIFNSSIISFSESNLTTYKNLDEYKLHADIPTNYSWKNDTFAGYPVVYPINTKTGNPDDITQSYTGVEMNGKIYEAYHIPEGDLIQIKKDPDENQIDMSETYFNKTAMQTLADALNKVL